MVALSAAVGPAASAQITLRFEAPGVQASSVANASVANFDAAVTGASSSTALLVSGTGGPIGTFTSGGTVAAANQHGGAGGAGKYLRVGASASMTLNLASQAGYLGFWWSAADSNNTVTFKQGAQTVGVFNSASLLSSGLLTPGTYNSNTQTGGHFGNPNAAFAGQNSAQPYVFVNFYAVTAADKFDSLVFAQGSGGGFELDNVTAFSDLIDPGQQTGDSGGTIPVPEPAGLLAAGAGLLALARRLRRR